MDGISAAQQNRYELVLEGLGRIVNAIDEAEEKRFICEHCGADVVSEPELRNNTTKGQSARLHRCPELNKENPNATLGLQSVFSVIYAD